MKRVKMANKWILSKRQDKWLTHLWSDTLCSVHLNHYIIHFQQNEKMGRGEKYELKAV